MAKAENGPLGPVRGKLGNLIFSSNLGTPYVRTNPGNRKKPNEKEVNTRNSFGALTWGFINPIKPFLQLTYKEVARGNRSLQAARSYLIKNALERDGQNASTILPSKMLMSRGSLALPEEVAVTRTGNQLDFSWSWQAAAGPAANNDQLMLMAYHVEAGEAVTSTGQFHRRDGSARLSIADLPAGTLHVYLSFLSFDRSKASDSVYLGEQTRS